MTWDELKEKVKEMGCYRYHSTLTYSEEWITDGVWTFDNYGEIKCNGEIVSTHRTPEQMLMIMRGLE